MRYAPSEAEFACLSEMDEPERLHYFITRSMECEEVWSLRNADGWATHETPTGEVLPLWPYRVLAEAFVSVETAADAVSLEHFVYRELNGMNLAGIKLEIMPLKTVPIENTSEIVPGVRRGMRIGAAELFHIFDRKLDDEQYFIEG